MRRFKFEIYCIKYFKLEIINICLISIGEKIYIYTRLFNKYNFKFERERKFYPDKSTLVKFKYLNK